MIVVIVSTSGPSDISARLQPVACSSGTIMTPKDEVDSELSDMPAVPEH